MANKLFPMSKNEKDSGLTVWSSEDSNRWMMIIEIYIIFWVWDDKESGLLGLEKILSLFVFKAQLN